MITAESPIWKEYSLVVFGGLIQREVKFQFNKTLEYNTNSTTFPPNITNSGCHRKRRHRRSNRNKLRTPIKLPPRVTGSTTAQAPGEVWPLYIRRSLSNSWRGPELRMPKWMAKSSFTNQSRRISRLILRLAFL